MFDTLLPYLLAGVSVGGQYALIAVGYTLVYGILRLINFAHGDIFTAEDAVHILRYTGCSLAMIGRGSFGNPWLFAQANAALAGENIPPLPPFSRRIDDAVRQIELLASLRGERAACLEARHHLPWYLRGVAYSAVYRAALTHVDTLADIRKLAKDMKRDLQ